MALITCPDCQKDVSDAAEACPNCGRPVAVSATERDVTTIQQTSKQIKLQTLLASILISLGLVAYMVDAPQVVAGLMMVAGLVWLVVARMLNWWRHE